MKKQILAESFCGQTRLAVLEDGGLAEIYSENEGQEKLAGNIYLGRVVNVLPGMQAAFVDIGEEKNAYLSVADIQVDKKEMGIDSSSVESQLCGVSIKKLLKPGQDILVQILKEPGGAKGARASCHLTLPGRLCVLLPTVDCIGISRKITDSAERQRLYNLAAEIKPEGMGLIIRTAAETADEAELKRDIEANVRLWAMIHRRSTYSKAPALMHRDLSLIYRAVRDMLTGDDIQMYIDNEQQYRVALETADMFSAECKECIHLYNDKRPLFDVYGIDRQVEKALQRRVWLKSGGYLIIDYTEALTVIDVNTGKFTGKSSFNETVLAINCEAAKEIARQLRLRDIAGIIVIDFIDMESDEDKEKLLGCLRDALSNDRAKTNLAGVSSLGLVEMTRKRIHQPLHLQALCPCRECQGSGLVPSADTTARKILRELRARDSVGEKSPLLIETSFEVAEALLGIEVPFERCYVRADASLHGDKYNLVAAQENALPAKTRPLSRRNS